jgi:hypothetical protein
MNGTPPPGYRPPRNHPAVLPRPGAPPPGFHYLHGDVVEHARRTAAGFVRDAHPAGIPRLSSIK